MTTLHVARAVAWRSLTHSFKNPALLLPSIIFPLVFFVAFAGGLSKIGTVPGFDYGPGYTAFQFVFVFLQSAAFGGVFTGFGIAADWESGFARRLLLGAPHRGGLIIGYIGAALVRWLVTGTALTVVALLSGMNVDGDGVELLGVVMLGLLISTSACLWGAGIAMRFKTLQAGPLMQIPVFLLLFMAPVYVPLDLLVGWIHSAASWNPITAVMNGARGFLAGVPHHSGLAFACGAAMVALFSLWAVANLRRVERGQ